MSQPMQLPLPDRRRLLATSAIGVAAVALSACGITSSGNTTTGTLDVATVTRYGQGIVAVASDALAAPSVVALLGPVAVAAAASGLALATAALVRINTLTGGAITVSVNTTGLQAEVSTLLADASNVFSLVQGALSGLASSVAVSIGDDIAAGETLLALLAAIAQVPPITTPAKVGVRPMTEQRALAIASGTR